MSTPLTDTHIALAHGNGGRYMRELIEGIFAMSVMREFEAGSTLFGGNAPFIEEQYERYLEDPAAVAPDWRVYFDSLRGGAQDVAHAPVVESFIRLGKSRKVAGAMVDASTMHKQVLVLQMIGRFRTLGMFHADLDPLQREAPPYIADLDLKTYGFAEADLDTEFDVGSLQAGAARMRLRDIITALKDTYCRTLGAEYMYISDTTTKRFVQARLEPIRSRPSHPLRSSGVPSPPREVSQPPAAPVRRWSMTRRALPSLRPSAFGATSSMVMRIPVMEWNI